MNALSVETVHSYIRFPEYVRRWRFFIQFKDFFNWESLEDATWQQKSCLSWAPQYPQCLVLFLIHLLNEWMSQYSWRSPPYFTILCLKFSSDFWLMVWVSIWGKKRENMGNCFLVRKQELVEGFSAVALLIFSTRWLFGVGVGRHCPVHCRIFTYGS